jgi:hypothetical protein
MKTRPAPVGRAGCAGCAGRLGRVVPVGAVSRVAAVTAVAAALVLGAGTGTTLALWRDSASVPATAARSATISVQVNGSTTAALTGPTNLAPGVGRTVTATLADAAPVGAKNLRMQLHLDAVTSSNPALTGALEVAATTVATVSACTAAAAGFGPVGPAFTSVPLTSTGLAAGATRVLCLTVRLVSAPPTSARGQSGTLTLTFRGQQVRP